MTSDFFSGVEQVETKIGDVKGKIPLFYRKARCFTAVFPAKLWEVRRALPDRRFVPAQIAPGVAGVMLAAFEYYDVDIPPYNEFAIGIPVNSPYFLQVPGYNLARQMLRMETDLYVLHLPVTTEEARRGGVDFYGFPKFLASIDYMDTAEWANCALSEGGDLICSLDFDKIAARHSGVMKFFCHLYQDRQPQVTECKMNARQYAMSFNPSHVELSLGLSHPIARELDQMLFSTRPLMYMYVPDFQLILYGPENFSLPLLKRSLEDGMSLDLESIRREKQTAGSRA